MQRLCYGNKKPNLNHCNKRLNTEIDDTHCLKKKIKTDKSKIFKPIFLILILKM